MIQSAISSLTLSFPITEPQFPLVPVQQPGPSSSPPEIRAGALYTLFPGKVHFRFYCGETNLFKGTVGLGKPSPHCG